MLSNRSNSVLILAMTLFALIMFLPTNSFAHCDGIDGPVVKAAQKALDTENVNLVLIWVQHEYEEEITKVFENTLKVRQLSNEAKDLAEMYFFETLVRIHRAGEGAPFTGLKPAGRDLGPAIPAADKSVESGSAKETLKLLSDALHAGLHQRFMKVKESIDFDKNDVQAGRNFVRAYVEFLHYVEPIYEIAIKGSAHGHSDSIDDHDH